MFEMSVFPLEMSHAKKKQKKNLNKHLTFLRPTLDSCLTPTCLLCVCVFFFFLSRAILARTGFRLIQTNSWYESLKRDVREETHTNWSCCCCLTDTNTNGVKTFKTVLADLQIQWSNIAWIAREGRPGRCLRASTQHKNSVCDSLPGMLFRHSTG